MASVPGLKSGYKPDLISIINGFEGDVLDAIFISGQNCILTSSSDRSLRLWVMREVGRYWPSVEKVLPSPAVLMMFDHKTNRICTGLDNGTITDFTLSSDLNCLTHNRDILAHVGKVTGLLCIRELKWIISTSKDKTVSWFSDENGHQLGTFNLEAPGTCLQFDVATNCLFIGDESGRITLLSFAKSRDPSDFELVRQLRGHRESITSLCWDSVTSRLLSSSSDHAVILWDIGGGKGTAYELQGHSKAVSSARWWHKPVKGEGTGQTGGSGDDSVIARQRRPNIATYVISGGLDGNVFLWLVDGEDTEGRRARRQETPQWAESDLCQICSSPFFWNIKKMWTDMAVGVRQHHCRRCGKAVCEKCSPNRSVYPVMGFEREVRMCNECYKSISADDQKSLAHVFDARHPILRIRLFGDLNLMLTIGKNKEVKVWDLNSFL